MSLEALQEFTRISKYARYNETEKRRETWSEQVERKFNMHREKYADLIPTIEEDLKFAQDMMLSKHVLGSQRALQYGGVPILLKNAKLYNCTSSYCDRPRFFQEAMWLSLCGCGCGFSVQYHHIRKLPSISKPDGRKKKTYTIPDSIEGWADALGVLVSCYFTKNQPFPEWAGSTVEFDYSSIRKKGSLIKTSGAKAPGPVPLMESLERVRTLLDSIIAEDRNRLLPIHAYDIIMHAVDAVISGGIRRSATICLFSRGDDDMKNAKRGNWRETNPQRERSNNSVVLMREETSVGNFSQYIDIIKDYGEPGFVFVDDPESLFNPCAEINMYAYDEKGRSGWSFCNLSEINVKKSKDKKTFLDQCKAAAILGTIQAGYTSFSYLGPVSENIVKREALLGVSMTGMGDNPEIAFDPQLQKEGARLVKKVNAELSKKLGINQAARCTCIKPAGTSSCMLGTSSGIHPHHSLRYIRRAIVNRMEEPLKFFRKFNPRAVEPYWSKPKLEEVISFICEVPRNARTKVQTSALELLEMVKLTQENWISEGRNKHLCTQPWLQHNVSNSIHIKDNEWDEVIKFIYKNRKHFNGIAFMPEGCDKDYTQAPFTTIYTPDEIMKEYGDAAIMASGLIVDGQHAWSGNLWAACDALLGITKAELNTKQNDWVRRGQQFAERYFNKDIKRMTYCLKDVNNFKLWLDLKREYKEIPWEEFHEEKDNTKVQETVACAGGACEVKRL